MQSVVDINIIKENIKLNIRDNLFNWIDIRNDFHNIGINVLEEILKIDNIGLFTDSLNDAIKIREFNKRVPIIVNNITDKDQVYDIIMNNLILAINDYDVFEEINSLNIKDNLYLAVNIKVNKYEEGISLRKYEKIKDNKQELLVINNLFSYISPISLDTDSFTSLVNNEKISSFVIGKSNPRVSDGFVSKSIIDNCINVYSPVLKSYKFQKKDVFEGKKIKKDGYGIKVRAEGFNINDNKSIIIDDQKYEIVNYFDDCLYLFGPSMIKVGRKINLTNYYSNDYLKSLKKSYILNGKAISLDSIDYCLR